MRHYRLCLGVLAAVVTVAIAVRVARTARAESAPVVHPEGVFPLTTSFAKPRLLTVAEAGGKLYFLWGSTTDRSVELTRTDDRGTVEGRFAVTRLGNALRLRVGPSGLIAILWYRAANEWVISLCESGGQCRILPLTVRVDDIQFAGENLTGITYDGAFHLREVRGASQAEVSAVTPLKIGGPFLTLPLPENQVAIIRMTDAQFQVVETGRIAFPPFLLASPEIRRTSETRPDGETGLMFAAAASPTGHIYCALTGYQYHEGEMVTEFDRHGQSVGSIRYWLPTYPELVTSSNVYGHLMTSSISVGSRYVYLIDGLSRRVAYYPVIDK